MHIEKELIERLQQQPAPQQVFEAAVALYILQVGEEYGGIELPSDALALRQEQEAILQEYLDGGEQSP